MPLPKLPSTVAPPHLDDPDDQASHASSATPLASLIEARLSRRSLLVGVAAVGSIAMTGCASGLPRRSFDGDAGITSAASTLTFAEIEHELTQGDRVAAGYLAQVLIRWGDPVLPGAEPLRPGVADADQQARQFGYNCDFIAFMPLPRGSQAADHGLLCVNHEYVNAELMWPNLSSRADIDAARTAVEMAAHGMSVVEVKLRDGRWSVVESSRYARRITATTPMRIAGPAAGHDRMKTKADPTGTRVLGTVNNCAGGFTPWGTVLTAEENFHKYFNGDMAASPEAEVLKRYGFSDRPDWDWGRFHPRFDVNQEPHEPNRFGWIVEFDPYDPSSEPVKRTALGRFKHEGATTVMAPDGRLVVYSGDDQVFEYVYRFVTRDPVNRDEPSANLDLLDHGVLSVARFDDRRLTWLPLIHGEGPLTEANGFASQADVLINARRAADLLGATPLDRPEDVEPNPVNGKVYMALTNNNKRRSDQVNPANPRAKNLWGHIIEMIPPGEGPERDHAAAVFEWELFMQAGDPSDPAIGAAYHPNISPAGWFNCPDNVAFDTQGRLWISTDQGTSQRAFGVPDGMWATDVEGEGRALSRHFYACPVGAEMCGPCFTPDGRTLFVAVQHPGEGDAPGASTFDKPWTRWPDFDPAMPPRPSVVAITRRDDGLIGE